MTALGRAPREQGGIVKRKQEGTLSGAGQYIPRWQPVMAFFNRKVKNPENFSTAPRRKEKETTPPHCAYSSLLLLLPLLAQTPDVLPVPFSCIFFGLAVL